MKLVISSLFIMVSVCAYADDFDDAYAEANKRVIIVPGRYASKDFTPVPAGHEEWGACSKFAGTATDILQRMGHKVQIETCRVNGILHAYTAGEGRYVDNLRPHVGVEPNPNCDQNRE